jgi:hypothetical protein
MDVEEDKIPPNFLTPKLTAMELELAESMIDLSKINKDPNELTETEKVEITKAAYALLDLKKINTESLKTQVATIDDAIISKNVDYLVSEGILPPVEVISGGAEEDKRKRDSDENLPPGEPAPPISDRKIVRTRKPSAIIRQKIADAEADKALRESLLKAQEVQLVRLDNLPDNWDDFPDKLKNLPICDHNSASIVMDTLFPKDVTDVWRSQKKTCRTIYELSSVETQCEKVVEKKDPDADVCYICGFAFNEVVEGLQRTCEHILPIIQAVFFLELYTRGKVINPALLLEYDWAHRCCNYVKNDYSFLKTQIKNNYPTYVTNNNQISVTLSLIQNTKRDATGNQKFKGLEHIQPQIESNPEWKIQRLAYIRDKKMEPIVKYIKEKGDNGIALMIGYKNCLDNKNIHQSFLELLNDSKEEPPAKRNKGGKTYRNKDKKRTNLHKQTRRHTLR